MKSREIRQAFLDFFKKYDHEIVPSSPVVPMDDPTLLFTNAGMNQFKEIFLGIKERPFTRAADTQKCIRAGGKHNDLDAVGKDGRHHTFFEMLGNWSFGDYYKKDAIHWAWEFLTEVVKLPADRMYASVYKDDDESFDIWNKEIGLAPERIYRLGDIEQGDEENFWSMGDTGPCGPCSEIHFDQGEEMSCGPDCGIGQCDCDRYLEIWNLVFMEFNRDDEGKLTPLPMKSVDTGMGFERLTALLQGKNNNYDSDLFMPIINRIAELTEKEYEGENKIAMRVIADHIRSLTFAITDGALPSNEGRGYVLRRILRRAARFGHMLGMKTPFIYKLVSTLVDEMGHVFPEIIERANHVSTIIKAEEERFLETIDRGIEIFDKVIIELKDKNETLFPGEAAFLLHDTYGFPLDLTKIMAEEKGFSVDEKAFNVEMEKQREKARSANKFKANFEKLNWEYLGEDCDTDFQGYDKLKVEDAKIIKYSLDENNKIRLVLDKTPFYGESGGQVGDCGKIFNDSTLIEISDVQKDDGQFIHIGELKKGDIENKSFTAEVDIDNRKAVMRNHSATHLLHKALRTVLGEDVSQAGSLVSAEKLRFDFNHFRGMTEEEIKEVEKIVNVKIMENLARKTDVLAIEEAKAKGAMALFGEKYDDMVRVVSFDDYSMELCGGTHLDFSGEIGPFVILSESAISAGVRRIEAVTGKTAYEHIKMQKSTIKELMQLLSVQEHDIFHKIEHLLKDTKHKEKEIEHLKKELISKSSNDIYENCENVNGVDLYINEVEVDSPNDLRTIADNWKSRNKTGILVLGAKNEDKVNFLVALSKDLVGKYKAGEIIKEVAKVAGGGGGGRPDMAMAGGKDPEKLQAALEKVKELV